MTLNGMSLGNTSLTGVTSASFGTPATSGGVLMDSGSTLAVVPDAVLNELVTQVCGVWGCIYTHVCMFSGFFTLTCIYCFQGFMYSLICGVLGLSQDS